jgi:hypothetical protein
MIVKSGKLEVQPHIKNKILEFQPPLNTKELQGFLGILNYVNNFYPNAGFDREPLQQLLTKRKPQWTTTHTEAVQKIQHKIQNLPILTVPTSEDFILYTDASDVAWGGYLCFIKDEKEFIAEYASGVFPAEVKKWISSDKEIYGVICCLKKFALKLMHLPKFIIRTDCTRFLTFKEKDHGRKDGRGKYVRWQAYLNQYNYEVQHIPGK